MINIVIVIHVHIRYPRQPDLLHFLLHYRRVLLSFALYQHLH